MATATWPDFKITHKHDTGNWEGWTWPASELGEQYVYEGNNCRPVLKFTTPPAAYIEQGKLFLKIPWHRHNATASKSTGIMYLKLSTSASTAKSVLPNSSNYDAYFSCQPSVTNNKETHLATVEFSNLKPSKTYYVTFFGATDVNYINIGANTSDNENDYDFEIYTPVGEPNIEIIDNYNNTFTVNVTPGADGANNPAIEVDSLSWVYPGGVSTEFNNGDTIKLPLKNNNSTVAISVTACAVGAHNFTFGTVTKNINQYIAPPQVTGTPVLIYHKNKNGPTLKEPWTFKFNNVKAANSTSSICGYIVTLYYIHDDIIDILDFSYAAEDELANLTIQDPSIYDIKPGDEIAFEVKAFTRYGANNDGARLLGTATNSEGYIVQNAGIVRVKVNGEYKEGQVWVKADGVWREAETVLVKANNTWHESE